MPQVTGTSTRGYAYPLEGWSVPPIRLALIHASLGRPWSGTGARVRPVLTGHGSPHNNNREEKQLTTKLSKRLSARQSTLAEAGSNVQTHNGEW